MDLTGKVALVTGGASGIGAAVCRLLASRGARVVVADLDGDLANEISAKIGGIAVSIDVRQAADSVEAVRVAETEFGRLDIVHLNAGIGLGMPLDALDLDAYRRLMSINVDGVVYGLTAALPALQRAGGGAVIATSSLSGIAPYPGDALYAASKHAVVGLVRSAAEPLARQRVTINALCPGFTETPLVAPMVDSFRAAGFPMLGPDDVAGVVEQIIDGGGTGQAWVVQAGRAAEPYRFRGVPGASGDHGAQAPPDEVRTGEVFR